MIFQWVLLTLVVYRIQRLIVTDDFAPFLLWRRYLAKLAARDANTITLRTQIAELFTCPHCMSVHISWLSYLVAMHFISIPLILLQCIATMAICSVIADHGHDGE